MRTENMSGAQKGCIFPGKRVTASHRWLGLSTILLQILVCSLLVYALIIGNGDIVVSGCQRIGFYNRCLYNGMVGGCQCLSQQWDMSLAERVGGHGFLLAIVLAYSSLVTVLMGILAATFAQCLAEGSLWTFTLSLNALSLVGLFFGMVIYGFLTWDLFDVSQVTPGFPALLVALGGMFMLCVIMRHNANLADEMRRLKVGGSGSLLKL